MVDYYAARPFPRSPLYVLPNSRIRITSVHCAIVDGAPCAPCNEFQKLQPSILKAISKNGYITLAQRERDLALRRQINAQHDPLNVFPIEIQAEIFAAYCSAPPIEDVRPQVTLLSICKEWRRIAIDSPRLWTVFRGPVISQDQFCVEQVERWLQRSKCLPISLEFKRPSGHGLGLMPNLELLEKNEDAISDLVVANKDRIYALNTATLEVLHRKMIPRVPGEHAFWPILSRITMDGLMADKAVEVLRCCPQAIFVEFTSLRGNRWDVPPFVVNPCLRVLRVSFYHARAESDPGAFLDYISAPALVKMICQSGTVISPISALNALLQRSACVLSVLHLEQPRFRRDELLSLLKGQPSLRILKIGMDSSFPFDMNNDNARVSREAFEGFMARLLTNSMGEQGVGREYTTGEFLPHLEVVKYVGHMVWPLGAVDAVSSSHTGIPRSPRRAQGGLQQCGSSSNRYRPLRLLKFLITTRSRFSFWTIGKQMNGWNDLIDLDDVPSGASGNECRFECNFIENQY